MIPTSHPTLAQLPPAAKAALRRYTEARDAQLRLLADRRLAHGSIIYPAEAGQVVDHLYRLYQSPAGLGSVGPAWYDVIRRAALRASARHEAGLIEGSYLAPAKVRMRPWLQAADLELQGILILAVLDRFAEGGLDPADRDWLTAAWHKAGLG